MTDLLIVGLLLVIILILISAFAPEILIYGSFAFCIIGLIICIVILGAQFIHDPIGFLYGLAVNNPLMALSQNMVNETTVVLLNRTIIH